jgi:hypothetical protein
VPAERPRTVRLSVAVAGLTLLLSSPAVGYVLSGSDWTWMGAPISDPFYINPSTFPPSVGSTSWITGAWSAAMQSWTDAGADFAYVDGGTTSQTSWNPEYAYIGQYHTSSFGGGTLAVAQWWSSGGSIVDCDIRFYSHNDYGPIAWSSDPAGAGAGEIDLQYVATHELGHCLGLDHSLLPAAVMYAFAVNGAGPAERQLDSDDVAGLTAIYGSACEDLDGDGYSVTTACALPGGDCDDSDPFVSPGAVEACNGFDDDCDGQVDEGFDADGDGYATCDGDCDDGDPAIHPGAPELCNGFDDDCDGPVDEGAVDASAWHVDGDGDGHGHPSLTTVACSLPSGHVAVGDDCDDGDAAIHPGATESCDAVDSDCDGDLVDGFGDSDGDGLPDCADGDSDGDGDPDASDCAPLDPTIFNGALELCDLVDSDCDGSLVDQYADFEGDGLPNCVDPDDDDDGDPDTTDCAPHDAAIYAGAPDPPGDGIDQDCDGFDTAACYVDGDGDDWGDAVLLSSDDDCLDPGEAKEAGDCDDGDASIHPGAPEVPGDGIDQDCDGLDGSTCPADADGDGFGGLATVVSTDADCTDAGEAELGGDCDDADPSAYPGAPELCDGDDEDCDGDVDEGFDSDADGFTACGGDCDDGDPSAFPGAVEACDGLDWDCDGSLVDEFADDDGDALPNCIDPDIDGDGFAGAADDCDDEDPTVHPGAEEACDLVDADCDGSLVDEDEDADADGLPDCLDQDGDGFTVGDGDCDDEDAAVFPEAAEACDGLDSDCDGDLVDEDEDLDRDGLPDCVDDDADGDGFVEPADCDDFDPGAWPGAPEQCDLVDSDCDGSLVDELGDADGDGLPDCLDDDVDGDGFTAGDGDCDDAAPLVFPGATESCDLVDSDCDGSLADEFDDLDGDDLPGCVDPDADGDGVEAAAGDCDDDDPTVFPGAPEVPGDGVDQDCDGFDTVICRADVDGDGFGAPGPLLSADGDCTDPGEATVGGDCDDDDPTIFPGAIESCDGIDQDCDGLEDEEFDGDGDGFATCAADCDDSDPLVFPDAPELCDLVDSDCDGDLVDGLGDRDGDGLPGCVDPDADGDGFEAAVDDCDDADATVHPGATESCDAVDQDCDGSLVDGFSDFDGDGLPDCADDDADDDGDLAEVDCKDLDPSVGPSSVEIPDDNEDQDCDGFDATTCHIDADGDGWGRAATLLSADGDCDDVGESAVAGDCADTDPAIHPGAPDLAEDGIDQDCNGVDAILCFADIDLDGVGSGGIMASSDGDCDDPGESDANDDCAPTDPNVYPGAPESCDVVDSDCDGELLDGFPDLDGDGQADCIDVDDDADGTPDATDCAPLDPAVHPGAAESCDLEDTDCDGSLVDQFLDTEGDGIPNCVDLDDDGDGAADSVDCAPLDPTIRPGAAELPGDGIDQDCDGSDGAGCFADADGDGYGDGWLLSADADCDDPGEAWFGGDCDELDPLTHPGAFEACDALDLDCDGDLVDGAPDTDGDDVPDCIDGDDDGDGWGDWQDCASLSPSIHPGAAEICDDGLDNDCDELFDMFDDDCFGGDDDDSAIDDDDSASDDDDSAIDDDDVTPDDDDATADDDDATPDDDDATADDDDASPPADDDDAVPPADDDDSAAGGGCEGCAGSVVAERAAGLLGLALVAGLAPGRRRRRSALRG